MMSDVPVVQSLVLGDASAGERSVVRPAAGARVGVSNALIGAVMLVGTETMFFAGLLSALWILRAGAAAWPPPGQPRLPLVVTGVNTLLLLLSGYCMQRAIRAARAHSPSARRWLAATAALGASFLVVQGTEWVRLIRFGLTATSGVYGATFYTLIGAHGIHVLAGLLAVVVLLLRTRRTLPGEGHHGAFEACWAYWQFVVTVWPVLFVCVYLT